MHYLVDAYNLLFRIQKKIPRLENCRKLLIEQINESADQLGLIITLVFDGDQKHLPYAMRAHFNAIAIVYTLHHQTADEYIIQEVIDARHPEQITVVSNDRELIQRCRLHKAHTQNIDTFFKMISKKEQKRKHTLTDSRVCKGSSSELTRLLAIFKQRMKEQQEESTEPDP